MAAVPLNLTSFPSKTSKHTLPPHLPNVPLWEPEDQSNHTLIPRLCLLGNSAPSLSSPFHCDYNIAISNPTAASPGSFFWCNGTLYTVIFPNVTTPCLPVTIVPQLTLYSNSELLFLLNLSSRHKRAAFLPVLIGISLITSVAGIGLGGGSLGHTLWAVHDLNSKLEGALTSTAESLGSLQRQITSLAKVALQNRRALDLLTAEKGGTCLFLKEECCYYVNESGIIETNIKKLEDLAISFYKTNAQPATWTSLLQNPFLTWLWPILGPLTIILLGCLFLPCLIKFLQTQVGRISNQTFNQLLLRNYNYRPLAQDPVSFKEQTTEC